jgi:hypothetical protein
MASMALRSICSGLFSLLRYLSAHVRDMTGAVSFDKRFNRIKGANVDHLIPILQVVSVSVYVIFAVALQV